MNLLSSCPICNSSKFKPFKSCEDFTYSHEVFDIVTCDNCSFRFTNPIPKEEDIGEYYKSENYISHTRTKKGLINRLYHVVRAFTLQQKFKLIHSYATDPSLLDIGCGTGDFLKFANNRSWKVMGLEPDEDARTYCEKEQQLEVQAPQMLHQIESNRFNIITLWHVLEHVYHLKKDVEKIKDILQDDGTLFVAVPNCSSYDAEKYEEYWAAYDLPIHLYHFKPANIKQLFESVGMEVIKILPMKFDAYYVSLLSEKYKKGDANVSLGVLFKGFLNGFISNWKAKKDEYSSQIYVIKHKK